jgi:hypothetical protein
MHGWCLIFTNGHRDFERRKKQSAKIKFRNQTKILKLSTMNAATLRQQLTNLGGSTGGHKEQADKYRTILDQILLQKDGQIELLKTFIEASE